MSMIELKDMIEHYLNPYNFKTNEHIAFLNTWKIFFNTFKQILMCIHQKKQLESRFSKLPIFGEK